MNVNYRQVDKVRLKGKKQVTEIFEVIEWEKELKNISLVDYLKNFSKAFELYQKGDFKSAEKGFSECLAFFPSDAVAKLLKGRCESFRGGDLPSNWDGAYQLTEK